MSETSVQSYERQTGKLIAALRDEFKRAYDQDSVDRESPLGLQSGESGEYYRVVNKPLHGKYFTAKSVAIVRKPPHPNDDPYNFTEIYAPADVRPGVRWADTPPGTNSSLFYIHVRRMKAGFQQDTWVMVDESRVAELDNNPFEPIPISYEAADSQRCASKLLDLMRRENLIAVASTEIAVNLN